MLRRANHEVTIYRFIAVGVRLTTILVLKILAAWTLVSLITSLAIAPALSKRVRDINFPDEEK
jgi:hypothetical protein